jgi:hypothetical protein
LEVARLPIALDWPVIQFDFRVAIAAFKAAELPDSV